VNVVTRSNLYNIMKSFKGDFHEKLKCLDDYLLKKFFRKSKSKTKKNS
jgi:hypothetical protein